MLLRIQAYFVSTQMAVVSVYSTWHVQLCLNHQLSFGSAVSKAQESLRGLTHSVLGTGKSVSEALILDSVNPQYDNWLLIDLRLQYEKNPSSEHAVYKNCFEYQNRNKKQFMYTTCSEPVVFMYWTGKSMNNLLSYCGLVDSWCENKCFWQRFNCKGN